MKLNKKIEAFTLSELLVVLVISSIVISLTFLVLSMVQKQVRIIQSNFTTKQQVQFVERMFWKDFNQYTVSYKKDKDVLVFTSAIDSLSYQFYSGYIVRKKDTLPIQIQNKKLFLDGKEVQSGLIDALQIETTPVFGDTELFVYQNKDASFYMNN